MVRFKKGHKNSKGEKAEWVIISHKTGKVLSSHKSKKAAQKHLQQMHIFKENTDMKTVELKWIEDDNGVVAEDAFTGMKELIETGVFPNMEVKCEYDTLYITGEPEAVEKAVIKIQKDYAQYGQIMIKENKNGLTEAVKVESFDDNVQDIFNHVVNYFAVFKSKARRKRPLDYIQKLNDFILKFTKLKDTAKGSDKLIIKKYIDEANEMIEDDDGENTNLKPIRTRRRKKVKEPELPAKGGYVHPNKAGGEYWDGPVHVYEMPEENEAFKIQQAIDVCENNGIKVYYKDLIKKQLSNPENWGIIEEKTEEQADENLFIDQVEEFLISEFNCSNDEAEEFVVNERDMILKEMKKGEVPSQVAWHIACKFEL